VKKKYLLHLILIVILFAGNNLKSADMAKGENRKDGVEAIFQACEKGNVDEIKELLTSGVDINSKDKLGKTPLCFVISGEPNCQNRDRNEMPVAEDSDSYFKRGEFFLRENEFDRALEDVNVAIRLNPKNVEASNLRDIILAQKGQLHGEDNNQENRENKIIDIVKLLIAQGADVNIKDNSGDSPLHYAAAYGYTNIAKELIAHGVKINIRNNLGDTPLHTAVFWGHKDTIEFFLSYGADKTSKTKKGNTPLDYAIDAGFSGIVKLLGGDTDIVNFINNGTYTVIISEPSEVKRFLNLYGYGFNSIWIPQNKDIERLVSSFQNHLLVNKIIITKTEVDRVFVIANFNKYNREYSGFIRQGKKYIICNMVLNRGNTKKPDNKHFSFVLDGGSAYIRVIFDAQYKQVIQVDGNGVG
jgi:ankyrin repeat protein